MKYWHQDMSVCLIQTCSFFNFSFLNISMLMCGGMSWRSNVFATISNSASFCLGTCEDLSTSTIISLTICPCFKVTPPPANKLFLQWGEIKCSSSLLCRSSVGIRMSRPTVHTMLNAVQIIKQVIVQPKNKSSWQLLNISSGCNLLGPIKQKKKKENKVVTCFPLSHGLRITVFTYFYLLKNVRLWQSG